MKLLKDRENTEAAESSDGTKKHRRPSKRTVIIAAVAVIVVVFAASRLMSGGEEPVSAETTYVSESVMRRDITSSLTGSGSLSAANSYTVTSMVDGEILSANFEEGDVVEKDSVLYEIDSADVASNIETNEMSLASSQRSYQTALEQLADLTVTAPEAGTLVSLDVEVGDEVSAGQTVATIRDSSVMELEVDFPADAAQGFYVGQDATVTLDSTFETLPATVTHVSASDKVASGNSIVRTVTLEVQNPGAISTTQLATAEIDGIGSSGSGTFAYRSERAVTADVSGTVASLAAYEGDWLESGQTILQLESDTLADSVQSQAESVRRAEISLDNAEKALDNYTIESPISGTVIEKNYNVGENAEQGETLCTIYDLSYLEITLNVDELDISDVEVGQEVQITAEAVEDKVYSGTVTKVSVVGTSSGSYTSYPVTIRIDDTEDLLPGMNVDVTIVVDSVTDAVSIPIAALERGNVVLITADSPSAVNAVEDMTAPEGYVYVQVATGLSDDDYIEITSGLTEGDTVAYDPTAGSLNDMFSSMMGGGGMAVSVSGPGGGMR